MRATRYVACVLACLLGAAALVALEHAPAAGALTYRGFLVPAAVADGRDVRWARAYAKIELPDNGWRPMEFTLELRAGEKAAASGTRLHVSVDDIPIEQVVVRPGWHDVTIRVARPSSGRRLALQLASAADADVGVGRVSARGVLLSAWGALWASAGALLGGLIWLTFAFGTGQVAAHAAWRRGRLSTAPRAACALAIAAVLAVVMATIGYSQLGALLSAAIWRVPAALGMDAAFPWAQTLVFAPAAVFHVIILVGLITLPGWFVLAACPRLRPGGDASCDALLAMPITLALAGATLVLLQVADVENWVFTVVLFAVYGAIAAALAAKPDLRKSLVAFIRINRLFLLLQVLVPLCALFYLSVGLHDSGQIADWTWAARRNLHTLPDDNELSWLASLTWMRHVPADSLFGGLWRISDRGPLLAVVHSFFFRALDPGLEYFPHYIRLAIVLNGTFASALFVLLRQWSSNRVAWGCAALAALNPWNFLNVYYTWPKMFGAYFLIAAMAILWTRDRPTLGRFVWCGALFGMGGLAHAGNLLSFPVFFVFTLAMYGRRGAAWAGFVLMPVALALTQIPWTVYTRLYSPATNNLIIMHYLGEVGYFHPIGDRFRQFMAEHPWPEQLAVRRASLSDLWWTQLQFRWVAGWWQGRWDRHFLGELYGAEFFQVGHSVGLLWFPWIVVGSAVNLAATCLARARRGATLLSPRLRVLLRPPAGRMRLAAPLAALGFACVSLSLNTILRWRPPHSHELPYFEILLVGTIALYVLRYLGWFYWLMALVAILIRQAQYFTASAVTSPLHLPAFDANGLLFWIACGALVLPAFIVRDDGDREPELADADARDGIRAAAAAAR